MLLFSLELDLFCAGLILVPFFLLLNRFRFRDLTKAALYCVFSLYLVAVYHLVGLPCITYINPGVNLNLIPLVGMAGDLRSTLLNVALFIPLGILLRLLWKPFRNGSRAILFGFGLSLCIELLQLLTLRATDINDLITNTLGTFLGFLLAGLLVARTPPGRMEGYDNRWDAHLLCGLVFAVMFFADPYIFTFFWNLILH